MTQYNEEYYERGEELGISGYTNYRWLPHLTIPMCESMVKYAGIEKEETILDFGCAKGFIVKALREIDHKCWGVDLSEYAIQNADQQVKDFVKVIGSKKKNFPDKFDWVVSKDVFEHISYQQIENVLKQLSQITNKLFCVVPLGKEGKYIVPDYEKDITHLIREDLDWWEELFNANGFNVLSKSYRVKGIKENWSQYEYGNGFFVMQSSTLPAMEVNRKF